MKEYRISIKPYLNKRVQPINISRSLNGTIQEVEAWPLYYQVVYKRKNTNIRSAYAKGLNEFTNHFVSLDDKDKIYDDAQKVIKRDIQIIEQIIRYKEKKEADFSIIGIRNAYEEYAIGLHHLLNEKLLTFLSFKVVNTLDPNSIALFNFKNGSAYTIYRYADILFKHLDMFTLSEHKSFALIKTFFEIYYKPMKGLETKNLRHHVGVPRDYFNDPLLIDFLKGDLRNMLLSKGLSTEKCSEILNTISLVLKKPRVFNL